MWCRYYYCFLNNIPKTSKSSSMKCHITCLFILLKRTYIHQFLNSVYPHQKKFGNESFAATTTSYFPLFYLNNNVN